MDRLRAWPRSERLLIKAGDSSRWPRDHGRMQHFADDDAGYVAASVAARAAALGFEPTKLTRLINELNDNHRRSNAYAAHALLRALLDHIPPLLGCTDFKAAASSHSWGRTDRSYARKLAEFKLQADDALHRQVSAKTDLLGMDDMPRESG